MPGHRRLLTTIVSVIAICGILLAAVAHFAQSEHNQAAPTADTAPLFAASLPDTRGVSQPLAQWRGQVLIVNFWATWCPPCRDEMPELSALHDKFHARGLSVLGIATDDVAKMQTFATEMQVSYPLFAADLEGMPLAARLGNTRDVLPYTVLVGRDGKVVASYVGRINSRALEQALNPLL